MSLLFVILLSAHLLLVDLAMCGPMVCVWLQWRARRRQDSVAAQMGPILAHACVAGFVIGISLGGVLLAWRYLQSDQRYFTAAVHLPPSRLWFASAELVFYFACMAWYVRAWKRDLPRPMLAAIVAIAAASNLMMHFPALFSIISVASARGDWTDNAMTRDEFRRLLVDGEVVSRVLHVWLSALAVTGVALMGLAGRQTQRQDDASTAARAWVRRGAVLALVPTLLQLPSGLWLAMQMPSAAREPLLGRDLVASGLFVVALTLVLALAHRLASVALGQVEATQIRRAAVTLIALVFLMVSTRTRVRVDVLADQCGGPSAIQRVNFLQPTEAGGSSNIDLSFLRLNQPLP